MMQVNAFIRLKQEAALSASVVLCLQHLKSQPRVGLSPDRLFRAFSPVSPKYWVVWTVSSADFDVACDRYVYGIQQGCRVCSKDPVPIALALEVALSHPFA